MAPLRAAFVGQSTFFEACAPSGPVPGMEHPFIEFRKDADAAELRRRLEEFDPGVIVVFRPEVVPAGLFEGLRAPTVGFLTEPIPRGPTGHQDQERRLWELRQVDAGSFDRVIAFDPLIAETADAVLPVWRSVPLPVADRYYAEVRPPRDNPRGIFVGRSTTHREALLVDAKHEHDLLHMAFGVGADHLEELMAEHDVAVNLHNEPYPSFENRVCLHLAAGHLVLSEPLSPTHGLEPGLDYLEVTNPEVLVEAIASLRDFPGVWDAVRRRGRRKAEQFRASRMWPRILRDLERDMKAFGTQRRTARTVTSSS